MAAKIRSTAAKKIGKAVQKHRNKRQPRVDITMEKGIAASNDDTDIDKDAEGETDSSAENEKGKHKTSDQLKHSPDMPQGLNKRQRLEPSELSKQNPVEKFYSIDLSDIEEYEKTNGM
jgi:hypothetical protein